MDRIDISRSLILKSNPRWTLTPRNLKSRRKILSFAGIHRVNSMSTKFLLERRPSITFDPSATKLAIHLIPFALAGILRHIKLAGFQVSYLDGTNKFSRSRQMIKKRLRLNNRQYLDIALIHRPIQVSRNLHIVCALFVQRILNIAPRSSF